MRYYEDRWTGSIVSLGELSELIERGDVARYQVPRRFRVLPGASRRVLEQAEEIVGLRAGLEGVRRPWWRRRPRRPKPPGGLDGSTVHRGQASKDGPTEHPANLAPGTPGVDAGRGAGHG